MAQPSGQVALAAGNASEYFWYAQSTGIWDAKNSVMLTKTGSAGMSTEGGANVAVGDAATSYALGSAIDLAGPWSVIIRCRVGATSGSNGMVFGNAGYDNYLWLRQAAGLVAMTIDAAAGSVNPSASVTAMTTWGMVFNSGVLTVYKDGTSIGTSTFTGPGHLKITKLLSGYMSGQYAFDGTFECANVIPSALTAGDITTRTANPYGVLDVGTGTDANFAITSDDATFSGGGVVRPMASFAVTAADATFSGGANLLIGASFTLTTDGATLTGGATGSLTQGTITCPALKNNTGTVLANETGVAAYVYNMATGALVVLKSSQTTNASGVLSFTDALIVAGTTYRVVIVLSSGAEGMDKVAAT